MPNGKDSIAQAFYLAQLQACKGKCQCNVCKLLRRAADLQVQAIINPKGGQAPGVKPALDLTKTSMPGDILLGEEE